MTSHSHPLVFGRRILYEVAPMFDRQELESELKLNARTVQHQRVGWNQSDITEILIVTGSKWKEAGLTIGGVGG